VGARGRGTYSELSLLPVEVCKIDLDTVSVAQDVGGVVRVCGVNRDWTGGMRGLHANLILSSCTVDQTSAAVLLRIMMGEYGREQGVSVGSSLGNGYCPRWIRLAFMAFVVFWVFV
jgi:hypothetical protein